MRGRLVLAGLGLWLGGATVLAQLAPTPPAAPPTAPTAPPAFPTKSAGSPNPHSVSKLPVWAPPPYKPFRPNSGGLMPPGSPVPNAGGPIVPPSPGVGGAGVMPAGGTAYPVAPVSPLAPNEPRPLPPSLNPGAPVYLLPAAVGPTPPQFPQPVQQPGALAPTQPGLPDGSTPLVRADVTLPYPEQKFVLDPGSVTARRINDSWQVWVGPRVLRDLGEQEENTKEMARVMRDLRPTEWAAIGGPRPVVEYGLVNGRAPIASGSPRQVVPIDLKTVRVEAVRGVWCLRDNDNILFNFGLRKPDADQALAVVQRYGFNRIGIVGGPDPAMTYLFVVLGQDQAPPPQLGPLNAAFQENALTRTGIPIPGIGYVGEMVKIDVRKAEVRRENNEWVIAFGQEVLGRFGHNEWSARDALRVMQDCRFTEFCRVGSSGLTFFLVNGKAPTRVPLAAQGRRYDLGNLRTQPVGDRWAVTESGRHLFDVASAEEGEAIVRLLKHFQFDQVCQMGPSPRLGLFFLAKSR